MRKIGAPHFQSSCVLVFKMIFLYSVKGLDTNTFTGLDVNDFGTTYTMNLSQATLPHSPKTYFTSF